MPDTTTPHQGQKNDPLTLGGSHLGTRVTLTWRTSRGSEGTATGILEAVEHELELHFGGRNFAITTAQLVGMPAPLVITGWGEAQPLESNTTPNN